MLFENKERTNLDPAWYNENLYNYFDRSAREDISKIRFVLNEWLKDYPNDESEELKSRFRKNFSSAFYELFIYELFKKQGFKIAVHPKIQNTSKRPDFLIEKNGLEIYIEAKEVQDKTSTETAEEKRLNHFYDSIDIIKSPSFSLSIDELVFKTQRQPSTRNIIKLIEKELKKHDPDQILEQIKKNGYSSRPTINYEDENFTLTISFIPKSYELRSDDTYRTIGVLFEDV